MIIIIVVAISSALAHHDLGKQTKKCKPFRNCKCHTFLYLTSDQFETAVIE